MMAAIPDVFNQPGAAFVLLRDGIKFPPIEDEWQKKTHPFQEATAHKGNIGLMAGPGFIGLDQDVLNAFEGLTLPITTTWETRPGRFGLWFRDTDNGKRPDVLAKYGKKADQAQLKLFKNGQPVGEVKLERTYQVIPPSWKVLEDGSKADYKLLDSITPAEISLEKLLADLQAIGITFSSKLEANISKLESIGRESRQKRSETDEKRTRKYAEAALRDEVLTLVGAPEGNRNDQLNKSAFALGQFVSAGVLSESEVVGALSKAAMNTGLELEEIRATITSGLEAGARHPREIPEADGGRKHAPNNQATIFIGEDSEELTEGGNASRLERIHGNDLRYNHTYKKWYLWDGGRWRIDANGGAARLAEDVVAALYLLAAETSDSKERDEISGFAKKTDSRKGITNLLALAANREKFALTMDDFDKNPWLLVSGKVTIDLKTCKAREPERNDFITMQAGAIYDLSAKCPTWDAFLWRIFAGNKELIAYVKRAIGYCLTGSTSEQVFFFCHGTGANGKSVFLAVLRALMGEYAKQADFSSFMIQRNEKVRNDLAGLAGARVITAVEAEEGGRLSMQVLKSWTGGDPITARFLFGENFTFRPQGKIWLAANTKPAITERNYAAWRRVHLIPFNVTIPPDERDPCLEDKLVAELPGVFNWALEGLRDYLKVGLKTPEAVTKATDEYRQENDSIESFLAECCELKQLNTCKNTVLYPNYVNFCNMSGLHPLSQHKFSPEMNSRPGIHSTRDKFGVNWRGIDLKPEWKGVASEQEATSQASGQIGVGLPSNVESKLNSSLREGLCAFDTQATPNRPIDSDVGSTPNLHQSDKTARNCHPVNGEKSGAGSNSINNLTNASNCTCAVCGEDLAGKGSIQKGNKFYCAKVGCGYSARCDAEAST